MTEQDGDESEQMATRRLVKLSVFALVLSYAASWLGYALTLRPSGVVFLWPPSGLMLGWLLLAPRRHWPALLVGGMVGNLLTDWQHGAAYSIAFAGSAVNALEQFVGRRGRSGASSENACTSAPCAPLGPCSPWSSGRPR
jgi:integral membrane sensor domain MASE1